MNNIDCSKTIQYIMNNFDSLRLAKDDVAQLRSTLSYLKIYVLQQIVQEAITNSDAVKTMIEEAKETLTTRIETLEQKKIPEVDVSKETEGLPPVYQEHAEKKHNASEEKRKNDELDSTIQKLDSLSKTLDNPEKFIEMLLEQEFGKTLTPKYVELMNICATNMAYGYMSMESARIGETEKNIGYETGAIDGDFGVNLFKDIGPTQFSSYHTYVPNPEAIQSFLGLIRNPDLVNELTDHYNASCSVINTRNLLNQKRVTEENAQKVSTAFNDLELCTEVEDFILEVAELVEKRNEISDKRSQEVALTQVSSNPFVRFINKFFKKNNQEAVERSENLRIQEQQIQAQIKDLVIQKHTSRIKEDPNYAMVYSTYMQAISAKYEKEEGETQSRSRNSVEEELKKISMLSKVAKKQPMREYVLQNASPEKKLEQAQKETQDVEKKLSENEEKLKRVYEHLSPEAKELVDNSEIGYIRMYDIKERYIDNNARSRYGVSPFVASLILETVMSRFDLKTAEDLEKFGVTITNEQVEKKQGEMIEIISRKLEDISRKGQEVEER